MVDPLEEGGFHRRPSEFLVLQQTSTDRLTNSPHPSEITDLLNIFGASGWSGGKAGTSTVLPVVMETSIPGDHWQGYEPHVVTAPQSPQQH